MLLRLKVYTFHPKRPYFLPKNGDTLPKKRVFIMILRVIDLP